jgi:peptidoglycan/xylan/chitin deacetylase (PgdA/CDA1 family)
MPGPSDLLILCYHAVSAGWPTDFAVAPEDLRRQVGSFLRRGYRPMTLSAALAHGASGKALVVTFDDAYRSVIDAGLPALSPLGVPATVFVPTSFAGSQRPMAWAEMAEWEGTEFESELDPMSWEELHRLAGAGWEIGSHSRSHVDLVSLEDADLAAELGDSRAECEAELRVPCRALAYPFSSYDERVKGAARAAGYESAVILDNHLAIPRGSVLRSGGGRTDRFELLRTGVYRHDGRMRLAAKTSRTARLARASAPWRRAAEALSGS